VSIHPEGTIGRLRYLLGGDRPSQTTRLALSRPPLGGCRLDALPRKSGISPLPPASPQARLLRLPPILRRPGPTPRPGCSKAPRGLFVLSQVTRIFTGTSISPSPPSRQCSSRYAFRAGRNLPDKEFRYLRTVIVTAAVHRGFGSPLQAPPRLRAGTPPRLPLTFRHWAGVSPYTAACAVAETCVFGKQSLEPAPCGPLGLRLATMGSPHPSGAPLLPKLRGQFAEFLNGGSLVHLRGVPPAHQCRCAVQGTPGTYARAAFLGASGVTTSGPSSGPRRRPPGCPVAGGGLDLPGPPRPPAHRSCPSRPAGLRPRVPAWLPGARAGLSTCCPSPTLEESQPASA
jgi:hypothetical protein